MAIQPSAVGLYVNRNAGTVAGLGYYCTNRLGYKWNNDDSATWSFVSGLVIPTNLWSYAAAVITPTNAILYLYNTNGSAECHQLCRAYQYERGAAARPISASAVTTPWPQPSTAGLTKSRCFNRALTPVGNHAVGRYGDAQRGPVWQPVEDHVGLRYVARSPFADRPGQRIWPLHPTRSRPPMASGFTASGYLEMSV